MPGICGMLWSKTMPAVFIVSVITAAKIQQVGISLHTRSLKLDSLLISLRCTAHRAMHQPDSCSKYSASL